MRANFALCSGISEPVWGELSPASVREAAVLWNRPLTTYFEYARGDVALVNAAVTSEVREARYTINNPKSISKGVVRRLSQQTGNSAQAGEAFEKSQADKRAAAEKELAAARATK